MEEHLNILIRVHTHGVCKFQEMLAWEEKDLKLFAAWVLNRAYKEYKSRHHEQLRPKNCGFNVNKDDLE